MFFKIVSNKTKNNLKLILSKPKIDIVKLAEILEQEYNQAEQELKAYVFSEVLESFFALLPFAKEKDFYYDHFLKGYFSQKNILPKFSDLKDATKSKLLELMISSFILCVKSIDPEAEDNEVYFYYKQIINKTATLEPYLNEDHIIKLLELYTLIFNLQEIKEVSLYDNCQRWISKVIINNSNTLASKNLSSAEKMIDNIIQTKVAKKVFMALLVEKLKVSDNTEIPNLNNSSLKIKK